ncbi:hypothetical protein [Salmonella enterica]|uniref:hypothetical protein n=1 Tax=Salmonella enterica TaxID=28901 RepID=UPI001119B08C|nr:hypothetical protein [Salmonella enterica]
MKMQLHDLLHQKQPQTQNKQTQNGKNAKQKTSYCKLYGIKDRFLVRFKNNIKTINHTKTRQKSISEIKDKTIKIK